MEKVVHNFKERRFLVALSTLILAILLILPLLLHKDLPTTGVVDLPGETRNVATWAEFRDAYQNQNVANIVLTADIVAPAVASTNTITTARSTSVVIRSDNASTKRVLEMKDATQNLLLDTSTSTEKSINLLNLELKGKTHDRDKADDLYCYIRGGSLSWNLKIENTNLRFASGTALDKKMDNVLRLIGQNRVNEVTISGQCIFNMNGNRKANNYNWRILYTFITCQNFTIESGADIQFCNVYSSNDYNGYSFVNSKQFKATKANITVNDDDGSGYSRAGTYFSASTSFSITGGTLKFIQNTAYQTYVKAYFYAGDLNTETKTTPIPEPTGSILIKDVTVKSDIVLKGYTNGDGVGSTETTNYRQRGYFARGGNVTVDGLTVEGKVYSTETEVRADFLRGANVTLKNSTIPTFDLKNDSCVVKASGDVELKDSTINNLKLVTGGLVVQPNPITRESNDQGSAGTDNASLVATLDHLIINSFAKTGETKTSGYPFLHSKQTKITNGTKMNGNISGQYACFWRYDFNGFKFQMDQGSQVNLTLGQNLSKFMLANFADNTIDTLTAPGDTAPTTDAANQVEFSGSGTKVNINTKHTGGQEYAGVLKFRLKKNEQPEFTNKSGRMKLLVNDYASVVVNNSNTGETARGITLQSFDSTIQVSNYGKLELNWSGSTGGYMGVVNYRYAGRCQLIADTNGSIILKKAKGSRPTLRFNGWDHQIEVRSGGKFQVENMDSGTTGTNPTHNPYSTGSDPAAYEAISFFGPNDSQSSPHYSSVLVEDDESVAKVKSTRGAAIATSTSLSFLVQNRGSIDCVGKTGSNSGTNIGILYAKGKLDLMLDDVSYYLFENKITEKNAPSGSSSNFILSSDQWGQAGSTSTLSQFSQFQHINSRPAFWNAGDMNETPTYKSKEAATFVLGLRDMQRIGDALIGGEGSGKINDEVNGFLINGLRPYRKIQANEPPPERYYEGIELNFQVLDHLGGQLSQSALSNISYEIVREIDKPTGQVDENDMEITQTQQTVRNLDFSNTGSTRVIGTFDRNSGNSEGDSEEYFLQEGARYTIRQTHTSNTYRKKEAEDVLKFTIEDSGYIEQATENFPQFRISSLELGGSFKDTSKVDWQEDYSREQASSNYDEATNRSYVRSINVTVQEELLPISLVVPTRVGAWNGDALEDKGKALANATFSLNSSTFQETKKTDSSGNLEFDDIYGNAVVGETYTLVETMTPAYSRIPVSTNVSLNTENRYQFVIDKNGQLQPMLNAPVQFSLLGKTVTDEKIEYAIKVLNERAPITLNLFPINQVGNGLLGKVGSDGRIDKSLSIVYKLLKSDGSVAVNLKGEPVEVAVDETGKAVLSDLIPNGTYTLAEEKAPIGYHAMDAGNLLFVVTDHSWKIVNKDGEEITYKKDGEDALVNDGETYPDLDLLLPDTNLNKNIAFENRNVSTDDSGLTLNGENPLVRSDVEENYYLRYTLKNYDVKVSNVLKSSQQGVRGAVITLTDVETNDKTDYTIGNGKVTNVQYLRGLTPEKIYALSQTSAPTERIEEGSSVSDTSIQKTDNVLYFRLNKNGEFETGELEEGEGSVSARFKPSASLPENFTNFIPNYEDVNEGVFSFDITIENTYPRVPLKLKSRDADTGSLLKYEGSDRDSGGSDVYGDLNTTEERATVEIFEKLASNEWISLGTLNEVHDLEIGIKYRIVQRAFTGYLKPEEINLGVSSVTSIHLNGVETNIDSKDGSIELVIDNYAKGRLPMTGREGVQIFMWIGLGGLGMVGVLYVGRKGLKRVMEEV